MNTADVVLELQHLKSEARSRRQHGDFDNEVGRLRLSVERGRAALAENPPAETGGTASPLAWEAADCLGMLGGALLRQAKVPEAIEVFQEGRDLEMSHPDAVKLTYNTVNWFVARLLHGGWR